MLIIILYYLVFHKHGCHSMFLNDGCYFYVWLMIHLEDCYDDATAWQWEADRGGTPLFKIL